MNLEWTVIISIVTIVFSVGFTYGSVKAKVDSKLKTQDDKMVDLEKKINQFGNADFIVRNYLFNPDATPRYAPFVHCDKEHSKLDKKLDAMEIKIDTILQELIKDR